MRTTESRSICTPRRHTGAAGAEQTRGSYASQGQGTGLSGPNWTMKEIADSLQVLVKSGGDDRTPTRGLLRDSESLTSNYNNNGSTDSGRKDRKKTVNPEILYHV